MHAHLDHMTAQSQAIVEDALAVLLEYEEIELGEERG